MSNEESKSDVVREARELLASVDKNNRIGYAFKLLSSLCDEVERLRTQGAAPPPCGMCDTGLVFTEQELAALADLYERTGLRTALIIRQALRGGGDEV